MSLETRALFSAAPARELPGAWLADRSTAQLVGVALLALLARALFIFLMPATAVSGDLAINWTAVTRALDQNQNPYNVSSFLNWPPLWMQFLYALHRLSDWFPL